MYTQIYYHEMYPVLCKFCKSNFIADNIYFNENLNGRGYWCKGNLEDKRIFGQIYPRHGGEYKYLRLEGKNHCIKRTKYEKSYMVDNCPHLSYFIDINI